MIKIIFFTDSKIPLKYFSSFEKSSKWDIEVKAHSDLRKELKKPDSEKLYILDYESIKQEEKTKSLNYYLRKDNCASIIIDRKNAIQDPADILMKGCDYLGGKLLNSGIKPARLIKYIDYSAQVFQTAKEAIESNENSCEERHELNSNFVPVEDGWNSIKSGKEYSFYMLFTEISIPSTMKKKSGDVHLNLLKQTFQKVAENMTTNYDGKLWIWNEYGGLILFPYDGKSSNSVIPGIKLLLNRVLVSIEELDLHTPIRLKVAMHLGNTTWKARGKTGTIISDSLNSIFHLGTKYTPLDDMDITEEVYNELPDGLKTMFSEAGKYEDRQIYRLCHLEVIS